jgi:hypothetical protein
VGKRIYCAVCGILLEDAMQLAVPQTQQDQYLDDGVHDNGIQNDGIRGNVETIKDKYMGAECNAVKNRLINVVRGAENLDPMHFYRYHVMALDPITAGPNMPSVLEREQQRDACDPPARSRRRRRTPTSFAGTRRPAASAWAARRRSR